MIRVILLKLVVGLGLIALFSYPIYWYYGYAMEMYLKPQIGGFVHVIDWIVVIIYLTAWYYIVQGLNWISRALIDMDLEELLRS